MKRTKTVTDAVIAANHNNGQESPGPKTERGKAASCRNAVKHNFTAKKDIPPNDDPAFEHDLKRWHRYHRPQGMGETTLVRRITSLERKRSGLEKLEDEEFARFQGQLGDVDGVFASDLSLPIDGMDLPIQRGWECEKLVVRATSTKDANHTNGSRGPAIFQGLPRPGFQSSSASHGNSGRHLEVQAFLGSTLDRIIRYRKDVDKQLYRAVEALRTAQTERREREAEESALRDPGRKASITKQPGPGDIAL